MYKVGMNTSLDSYIQNKAFQDDLIRQAPESGF